MAHVCLQSADVTFLEPLPASIKVALRATVEATSGKQAVSFAFAELVQDVSQVVHASSSACFFLPREEPASLCFDANFTQADRVTSLSRLFDTLQSEPTAADMLTAPDSMLLPSFNPDCATQSSWTAERHGLNAIMRPRLSLPDVDSAAKCRIKCCQSEGAWCGG